MSYTPRTWTSGEVITAAKLNNIEEGISEASQSGGGFDAVVRMYHSNDSNGDWVFTIESGTFANLHNMLSNNIAPSVMVRYWNDLSGIYGSSSAVAIYAVQNSYITFIIKVPNANTTDTYNNEWKREPFNWHSDDTISYYLN